MEWSSRLLARSLALLSGYMFIERLHVDVLRNPSNSLKFWYSSFGQLTPLTTKLPVLQAQTQISLRIPQSDQVFTKRFMGSYGSKPSSSGQQRLFRLGCPVWSESSLGTHHFVGFVVLRLIYMYMELGWRGYGYSITNSFAIRQTRGKFHQWTAWYSRQQIAPITNGQ